MSFVMKWGTALVLTVILGITFVTIRTVYRAGEFDTLVPQYDGTCSLVGTMSGPEDIAIDHKTGLAYIASLDRRSLRAGNPANGSIYVMDGMDVKPLVGNVPNPFHPIGISLYRDGGKLRLFAVNRAAGHVGVEVFDVTADQLIHIETIQDPLIVTPNDIAAVGPRAFYVTNDVGSDASFLTFLESLVPVHRGSVVLYRDSKATMQDEGLGYANGIAVSKDGRQVYVSATTEKTLHFYKRDTATDALTDSGYLYLNTGLDNIDVDKDGALWIANHPKLLTFMGHARDETTQSPSQIFKAVPGTNGRGGEVFEVMLDEGVEIAAASVAVRRDNEMLIGHVFQPGVHVCTVPEKFR